MNRDKDFSRPLKIILRLSEGQVTRDQLAREFECHERTITRNVETLRYAGFEIEEDYNQERRIFYFLDSDNILSKVFNLQPVEMLALLAAKNSLTNMSHTFLGDAFDSLMDRIWRHLPQLTKEWFESLKGHITFQGSYMNLPSKSQKILDIVLDCISRQMMMEIEYADRNQNVTERKISPIQILQTPNQIYIIAYCHLREDIRNFSLDRITKADLTGKRAFVPKEFNLQAYIAGAFIAFSSGPTQKVAIKLWGKALEMSRYNIFHPSQQLVEDKTDGSGILKMEVSGLEEVLKLAISFCHEAEVLEPPELKTMIRERISTMSKLYKICK